MIQYLGTETEFLWRRARERRLSGPRDGRGFVTVHQPRDGRALLLAALVVAGCCAPAYAGVVVRAALAPGVFATLKNARTLSLECRPPKGDSGKAFLEPYLAAPERWTRYKDRLSVAIAFEDLNPQTQRLVLLTMFPQDVVNEDGWWHTVQFAGAEGLETLWTLSEWLTGKGTNYKDIATDPRNCFEEPVLHCDQRVLVAKPLLREGFGAPTPERFHLLAPPERETPRARQTLAEEAPEVDLEAAEGDLTYGEDRQGMYAAYCLKQGEALYTAVVVRFTDFRENEDILRACEEVQRRSGISDVHVMKPGQKVLIPLDLLSDRFHPKGSERRRQYEAALLEAERLKRERVRTRDLDGVVVVLDSGHGGRDHGAAIEAAGLYEDELNYDITCRIKRILETKTRAKVYTTVLDLSQGYKPCDNRRFKHDTDEVLLTTPRYENTDARVSANLRWYLANSIYRREVQNGTDPRKMIFTSIHADALFNEKLRGAMIYIPGAQYRRDSEEPKGYEYDRYKEAREQRCVTTTARERMRDEALSRNFAGML
ncbi:MAG TPA: N-acetylmuramoyl-L-alanine amidase, partial [Candidatus Hydrogenedentes bacterium]|nr:N-acetylmuramoyl-L-alanine amidase [Candidatus Hydrogenedentota bacterium]